MSTGAARAIEDPGGATDSKRRRAASAITTPLIWLRDHVHARAPASRGSPQPSRAHDQHRLLRAMCDPFADAAERSGSAEPTAAQDHERGAFAPRQLDDLLVCPAPLREDD